jgi:hypothetical protein
MHSSLQYYGGGGSLVQIKLDRFSMTRRTVHLSFSYVFGIMRKGARAPLPERAAVRFTAYRDFCSPYPKGKKPAKMLSVGGMQVLSGSRKIKA